MSFDKLVAAALDLVPDTGRAVLGIAGAPGSGKTTLAEALVTRIAAALGPDVVAHVPMDGFHLADVQLERLGLRDRKGAPETFDAAGYAALLRRLRTDADRPVYAPGFERTLEQPIAGAVVVTPTVRLVVTEGNYLLLDRPEWRSVRSELDQVWWVETDDATRLRRLTDRHIRFGKRPDLAAAWVAEVDEVNTALVRAHREPPDRVVVGVADSWLLADL
ncbi:nucleoside/nucleotide kinase family protein [Nostocoides sp. F2B08]|uniref:nucleoside/nucleotide kinase family protein n=1 Tax=Nostocoides sp. F2B08 TaxID=2653936 RepID=UPI0012630473|nr:nucleoside/nucleotide kinase family protein [Tetrasphaera sp. F2B08]KAB7745459.1 nucleoside/nucleotide kinase family protein [Tetrasphaera sp. F2B08]